MKELPTKRRIMEICINQPGCTDDQLRQLHYAFRKLVVLKAIPSAIFTEDAKRIFIADHATFLEKMLRAGTRAGTSLRMLNNLIRSRFSDSAGECSTTVDLAELRLDTGHVCLYKWGAAPSWVLTRSGAEKIGTASPPPGLSPQRAAGSVEKLSLRRGEVLILLSDGAADPEELQLSDLAPDLPPGELAAKILNGEYGAGEDDATAAVIRLIPLSLAPS